MQTAKQALLSAGRIDAIKRGRISLDNHAWLKSQHDQGVRFTDWPKGEITVTKSQDKETGQETETIKVKRDSSQSGANTVAELMPYRYTEDKFVAVEISDGKRVERSLREACNNCRVSLVVCYCEAPRIVRRDGSGSVLVRIEPKK